MSLDVRHHAREMTKQIAFLSSHVEMLQEELKKERDENAALRVGIEAVRTLMNESYGVDGLHKNGDVAAWDDLEQGGRFEEWLYPFNKAEDYLGV